ncbi:sigma-70 family RNA polymerase sigma factor [Limobrevibacterium gyesilva]|uniref:Sigma-70 family RNA polymerase sigma factor n=1 Tax=Limobrevibacterium gyesilva TaxID=2991712 RepID=A0AA42CFY1_9PROT|nr:sigma-70 family RNA polymerase sigma factor [Limobrevibacterium gyesilva]MCW3473270.1 sigma-70 family RNA polymerase sigma factor [Limobrevibacterium gyesilva]
MAGVLSSIEACVPALRRYAHALLRSPQDADDLVHDTLIRALDKLHTKRSDAEVRPWLFAIMHNVFVTQLRRAKARAAKEPLNVINETVQEEQEQNLRWRDLMRSFNCLSEEQRAVILLVSVEDLSYAEAARVLDIPIGTVMSRLARGREQLRQMMQDGAKARPCLRRVK